jgi:hypothetical protein
MLGNKKPSYEDKRKTADLSTTLRSGRDKNSVGARISYFSWKRGIRFSNRIVISTEAQRSGEICGFFFGSHADCQFSYP